VSGVIDLHCHVLPGLDDGPATIEGSLGLARAAAAAGIRTILATPHVSARYRNEPATIARLVEQLNGRLAKEGIDVEIRRGAEIAASSVAQLSAGELAELRLGDGPWLLIEPSFTHSAGGLEDLVLDLQREGNRIVIAHPERCTAFHRDPLLLESLVHAGALTSVTAGALVGRFGDHVRRFALKLAEQGLIHNVASDAHNQQRRPPGIAEEIERAGLGALAEWLTVAVPAAILDGAEVPARPVDVELRIPGARRPWWRRPAGRRAARTG
jgi:protein-tyrosine phosphatase